ncbi:hypothetical protein [Lacticaseibacillus paracasei]|uniref:hypothetical protein n=1 Tax=Lacticaseibacillus paracasei TaxID=1597 RepID=UPI0031F52B91
MSNETKRDVFEDALDAYDDSRPYPHPGYDSPAKLLDRYNAALPDDLPVIPKSVGKYIKTNRVHMSLTSGIENASCISEWLWGNGFDYGNDSVFALAWVLGVWKVKETDEVVKL